MCTKGKHTSESVVSVFFFFLQGGPNYFRGNESFHCDELMLLNEQCGIARLLKSRGCPDQTLLFRSAASFVNVKSLKLVGLLWFGIRISFL